MAYKIHAIPAAAAAGLTAPYDGVAEAVFVDDNGKPVDFGGVKKGVAVAKVAAADAVAAAGAAPTKAEYDAVVTELNETKRQLNALLASLTAAGTIA